MTALLPWPADLGPVVLDLDDTGLDRLAADYRVQIARLGGPWQDTTVTARGAELDHDQAEVLHVKACGGLLGLEWLNRKRGRSRHLADGAREILREWLSDGVTDEDRSQVNDMAAAARAFDRSDFGSFVHLRAAKRMRRALQGPSRQRPTAWAAHVLAGTHRHADATPALVNWVDRESTDWWAGNPKRAKYAGSAPFGTTLRRFQEAFDLHALDALLVLVAVAFHVEEVPTKASLWLLEARTALATGQACTFDESERLAVELGDWGPAFLYKPWQKGVRLNTLKQARYQARDELAWAWGPLWTDLYELLEACEGGRLARAWESVGATGTNPWEDSS